MARLLGPRAAVGVVRIVTGAPVAADSATLTDGNFSTTFDATNGGAFSCRNLDTLFIGVELAGGVTPTATIEFLFRDAEAADGARWKRLLLGARPGVTLAALAAEDTGALDGVSMVEMRCYGAELVYPRIKAVTGNPTSVKILAMPGAMRIR